jgi:hypothetical protein
MSSSITAVSDPTYGVISGYALTDSTGTPRTTAMPLIVRPNDVIQFYNAESSVNAPSHSAFGFPMASFPPTPYSFPSSAASQEGTSLGTIWSTGRIPINGVGIFFAGVHRAGERDVLFRGYRLL